MIGYHVFLIRNVFAPEIVEQSFLQALLVKCAPRYGMEHAEGDVVELEALRVTQRLFGFAGGFRGKSENKIGVRINSLVINRRHSFPYAGKVEVLVYKFLQPFAAGFNAELYKAASGGAHVAHKFSVQHVGAAAAVPAD